MEFEPFKEKLTIPVGGTFAPDPWVFSTGETEETATPVDLTGCSAFMHVRDKPDSENILLTLSTARTTSFMVCSAWPTSVWPRFTVVTDSAARLRMSRAAVAQREADA